MLMLTDDSQENYDSALISFYFIDLHQYCNLGHGASTVLTGTELKCIFLCTVIYISTALALYGFLMDFSLIVNIRLSYWAIQLASLHLLILWFWPKSNFTATVQSAFFRLGARCFLFIFRYQNTFRMELFLSLRFKVEGQMLWRNFHRRSCVDAFIYGSITGMFTPSPGNLFEECNNSSES